MSNRPRRSPISRTGQRSDRDDIEDAAEGRQGAKRETPEKRFRQDREHEKIDRERDHDCREKSRVTQRGDEQFA